MSKSADYWEGRRAEDARLAARDGGSFADIARRVAQSLGRDQSRKNRILAQSPHLAQAFDAEELNQMSAAELAKADLKQYGLSCSDNSDPCEVRDAFHAGRAYERQGGRPAGMDSASGLNSALDNYLNQE